jgi:hypothetical protein
MSPALEKVDQRVGEALCRYKASAAQKTPSLWLRGVGELGPRRFCRNSGVGPKRVARLTGWSSGKAVELVGCRHGLAAGTVLLPLLDHVHGLDSGDEDSSMLPYWENPLLGLFDPQRPR